MSEPSLPSERTAARVNLLNTRTTNVLELAGNGRVYRVPPIQRDYSWTEEQWEDLWNDILDLRSRPDDRHYSGYSGWSASSPSAIRW